MAISDIPLRTLAGQPTTLGGLSARTFLIVNVASKCGLTPQYAGLERLHRRYAERGFAVLGFPCDQFGGQEPGTPEEIAEFCTTTYDVTFPMFEKVRVRGRDQHPLFAELIQAADADATSGHIRWNFEKFLVSAMAGVLARFRSGTDPEAPELIAAVEAGLD
jgi:glutathione peroxidase